MIISKPQAVTRTVTTHNIDHRSTQRKGGYLMYWKLYGQLSKMLSNKSEAKKTIMHQILLTEKLIGIKLQKKVNRAFFKTKLHHYTLGFIWFCLIKPLGQFHHKFVRTQGQYQVVDGEFFNISLQKSTRHFLFNVPIWTSKNQELTQEEIKELCK